MARNRDVVLAAVLPATSGLPAAGDEAMARFWRRFEAVAPGHVRIGLWVAVAVLGTALPVVMCGRRLARLDEAARERVVRRAARLPGVRDLLEVAKVVACLARFEDEALERRFRGSP